MPDRILTHKFFAIPLFMCIMMAIFYLTFDSIGAYLSTRLSSYVAELISLLRYKLLAIGVNPVLRALIIDGICAGIGSVLSFLPTIAVMFGCLSILESSNYMMHIARIVNTPLSKIGLPGQSMVPLLMGFGCSVPAILATRSLPLKRDRYLTVALIPFMSCSAKLPIYAVLISVFFEKNRAVTMFAIYVTGIIVAMLCALILNHTICEGIPYKAPSTLQPCKLPSVKYFFICICDNVKGFIKKAFTVILFAAVIIWFLQNFNVYFQSIESSEESILALLGKKIAPFFAPLGFDDWRAATAIITGLSAKEAVVGSLAVLSSSANVSMPQMLGQIFSPLSAFSFIVFCLLYTPCIATLATIKKEIGSWRYSVLIALFQILVAWLTSFLIFNIGRLFM